jgi:hypothetical protein
MQPAHQQPQATGAFGPNGLQPLFPPGGGPRGGTILARGPRTKVLAESGSTQAWKLGAAQEEEPSRARARAEVDNFIV